MIDRLIIEFDRGLRALLAESHSARPHPAPVKDDDQADTQLEDNEKRHAAALMRVNHCGEICAQALYNGQSLTARNPTTVDALRQASKEETEHQRLMQKSRHTTAGSAGSCGRPIH